MEFDENGNINTEIEKNSKLIAIVDTADLQRRDELTGMGIMDKFMGIDDLGRYETTINFKENNEWVIVARTNSKEEILKIHQQVCELVQKGQKDWEDVNIRDSKGLLKLLEKK